MIRETLILSERDIQQCITEAEILEIVDQVFRAHGEGNVVMPAKITLDMASVGYDSWINAMPGYLRPWDAAGIKWAGGFGANAENELPYILATIILNDPRTGFPLSIMDGTYITNVRTGASGVLAAKYCANSDAKVVAFIGAGAQSKMTLRLLTKFFAIEEVRAADICPEAQDRFKSEIENELGIKVVKTSNNREAVEGADIIFTGTQADAPLVMNSWLKKGATAISLGSYQEFDEEFVLTADKITVDSWAQCSHRGELKKLSEKGLITGDSIYAELGEIAAGKKPGRQSADDRILAVPIGLGTHDIAVAGVLYPRAWEMGLGHKFKFF